MGKKAKVGKKRKDKFYHLAKETGYRARSAFKLIQLNRKFGFLQDSRVLIDLCAAPGGWLQVAANFMPISSVILGIDLVAIKPIKNVTTFQADITTDHCRKLIKKELKTWKADVVLNDGAPNVGSAWVQDAFSQIQLALSALKLASDHLRKGGWFITKVFRSKDYNALLWVLQQLFKKVHSTKPQASRNESAEIFVVCQGYLAPDKLDERFLDPKHVFKEIQEDSKIRLNILRPEKHVRQREGYPENNITLHTTIPATQFIRSNNAIDLLATSNKIDINSDESISNHPLTTDEIKECCQDIKVLGRSELKALFAWRKKLRKSLSIGEEETEVIPNEDDEAIANNDEANSADEQNEVAQMVEHLQEEESKELKKKQKHVRKQKKKLQEQLATKLASANSENTQEEQDLFSLKLMKNKKELSTVDSRTNAADDSEESEGSDVDEDDNESVDSSDEEYIYGADELYEKPPSKKRMKMSENEPKKKKKNLSSDTSTENPLLVDLDHNKNNSKENATVSKAKEWFQKDIFKDIVEEDSDYDIEELLADKRLPEKAKTSKTENENNEIATNLEEDNISSDNDSDIDDDSDDDSDIDDRSISQGKKKETINNGTKSTKKDGFETVPMMPVDLGPEGLALGTAMVTSQKRRRDIIDDSFNRYTFNDDSLPSWFLEDEVRHTARQIPVTREEVQFYKNRMKEINARPIKKVIEAKAKKKSKLLKKLDRARKKAQGILDATDTSNQEKQNQIKGIYKKAGLLKNKKPEVTYVVAKRGLAGKKYKRPGGVKGQYKVVDPRMKKDLRAMKNKEKTKGRRKKK